MPGATAFPISQLPGTIPSCTVDDNTDPLPIAQASLIQLQFLDSSMLTEETLWRDLFALTGTARTLNGIDTILSGWRDRCALHQPYDFKLMPKGVNIMRPSPVLSWVQVKFTFRTRGTPSMSCTGIMRLVTNEQQTWKIWTLVTILQGIDGLPNVDTLEPAMDWGAGQLLTPISPPGEEVIHDCVVVGAGMSGLCTAGYLKAAGINAVILERNANVGQNWTDRYDSVSIHTSKACGQLPFKPVWGPEYPYHLDVDDLYTGYNLFVKTYGLDVWLSTTMEKANWDKRNNTWTLQIDRCGMRDSIRSRHLVLAIGGGGQVPITPTLANRHAFNGTVLHSGDYKNSKAWRGLKGVVIGSANSAHDISNDMLLADCASVTMVQRGRTPVLPISTYHKIYDQTYNDSIPVHVSDMMVQSTPTAVTRLMALRAISKCAAEDPEKFDSLERQGFRVERDMDIYSCLYERFGGHYVDVGVSEKISKGLIKMKSGTALIGFTKRGLIFEDGSELEADVVVFATGFEGNMRLAARDLVGKEVGDQLEDWWGVDCEGELRGAWKPIGHPGIWFTGGNVMLARFFSRFLALQIAADVKGMPLPLWSRESQQEVEDDQDDEEPEPEKSTYVDRLQQLLLGMRQKFMYYLGQEY